MSKMYDIFISSKNHDKDGLPTRDSIIAQELYEFLSSKNLNVFFSKVSLEILGIANFKKMIDDVLDSANIVIAVGTSRENLDSKWVRYEWDGFLNDILSDFKKQGQVFCYGENIGIFDLPRGLRQSQFFIHNPQSMLSLYNFINKYLTSIKDKNGIIKEVEGSKEENLTLKAKDTPVLNKKIYECMKERMIEIPAPEEKFTMGDNFEVIISHPFLIDKYQVTQDLYQEVMKKNLNYLIEEKDFPVVNVSWFDAIEFCNKLSEQTGLECVYNYKDKKNVKIYYDKSGYRLPTEAEWEYACCRGTTEELYVNLDDIAWYNSNSEKQTHGVGGKDAIFDIFDMLGNVWEWCNDWYEEYPKGLLEDPIGPKNGYLRSLRGGSWVNTSTLIQPGYRERKDPFSRYNNQGIRLVRSLNQHVTEEF